MANYKNNRLAEDIKREISICLREFKDPRIAKPLETGVLSVVRVDLAGDGSHCKVYMSCLSGMDSSKEACKALSNGSGLIKRHISNALHMRKCPELHFIPDDSIQYSAEINKILRTVSPEKED